LNDVDDWNFVSFLDGTFTVLLSNQRPQFVEVESWGEFVIAVQMEIAHTNFAEVSGMVFVVVDSVMMHTTSVTTTSRMLTVLT
jgi:hypothetical protein